jgi:SWI/SNF-related matrix-associated actin-dependent regulator of chromatin subfamily A3
MLADQLADNAKIQDISFTLSDHFQSRKQYGELTVSLERNGELRLEEERFLVGQLDDQTRKIIHGFMQEDSMDLQVSCVVKAQRSAAKRKPGLPTICPVGTLSVIIYGPLRMFDEVGEYMGTCGLFLQDPKKCDRNVRYRNPHRMSGLSEHAPWTLEQQMDEITILRETVQRSIDYLAEVDAKQNLPETSTPHCLKTELLS